MAGFISATLIVLVIFGTIGLNRGWRERGELRQPELQILAITTFSGWIGTLVTFIFLPLMQIIDLIVWIWFLLGIGLESQRIESRGENRYSIAPFPTHLIA